MIDYNYKNLKPFKWFVLQNFPFIEADFDAITNYQLFCRIGEEINKIINKMNLTGLQVEELTDAFNELEQYVNDVLSNLNLQDEVNNKLDAMAEDGTLATIINEQIFNELNDKITELNSKIDNISVDYPDFFIGGFFHGRGDTTPKTLHFYSSLNGTEFSSLPVDTSDFADEWAGDVSLVFDENKKRFLLAMSSYSETRDCLLYETYDFKNWVKHEVNLGYLVPRADKHRWAPELFFDEKNGSLYLTISIERTRKEDNSDFLFDQLLYKCNNLDELTFDKIGIINLSSDPLSNYIDGNFCQIDNYYYLAVKNGYNYGETIELNIFRTENIEDLSSYTLYKQNIFMDNLHLEAPCMCKVNNKLNIYAENYKNYYGYSMTQYDIKPTGDIEGTTKAIFLESLRDHTVDNLYQMEANAKHGTVLFLNNIEAKKIITDNVSVEFANTNALPLTIRTFEPFQVTDETANIFVAFPNVVWDLSNITTTFNIVNLINPYNIREMYIKLPADPLNIYIQKFNGQVNYKTFSNNGGFSQKLIKVVFDDQTHYHFQPNSNTFNINDINLVSSNGTLTEFYGVNINQVTQINFILKITNPTAGNVKIANLPLPLQSRFRVECTHYTNPENAIYIDNDGSLYILMNGLTTNTMIRCSATYIPKVY